VILLCGVRTESPVALVAAELDRLGELYRWFDQRRALSMSMTLAVAGGEIAGHLLGDGVDVDLREVRGVYLRLMDDRLVPEVERLPEASPGRRRCRRVHEMLLAWTEVSAARVVNRASAQLSNGSKPYQAQLIAACGFRVPRTLVTNDPELVVEFASRHRRVVYKSTSGVRSIVTVLGHEDRRRLDLIRWCPVQFQEYVEGTDVRVHTIGERVFAARIHSPATDYRYARRQGAADPVLEPCRLDDDVSERCVLLSQRLGLEMAGIDLRLTPEGEAVCFEVNPSPAYSYYEQRTGLRIAEALAVHLAGR
jgi:hypothetical protein